MTRTTVHDPSSPAIRRAMAAVEEAVPAARADPARPVCHFRPPARWMNDPNGTLYHGGWYHLFYQHHPFSDEWGAMHWGHARSRDLVRWEQLPIAFAPSPERGEGHCFSGCAWRDTGGAPVLLYSSFPPSGVRRSAEQWIVEPDEGLVRFRKPADNPVLGPDDHGGPRFGPEWRDPFVFEEAGRVFLLLGVTLADEDDDPAIALWEAEGGDPRRWRYRGLLHRGRREETAFFECPNLLRLGDRHLLVYSAHRPVAWLLGDFSPDSGRFRAEARGRIDHSPSFYASGAFVDEPRGRRVVVGWVRGWSAGRGWNGVLGLPRVLSAGPDGRPRQAPLPELDRLRGDRSALPAGALPFGKTRVLPDLEAGALEFRAELDPGGMGAGRDGAGAGADGGTANGDQRAPERGVGIRLRRASDGEPVAEVRLTGRRGPVHVSGRALSFDLDAGRPPAAGAVSRRASTRIVDHARPPDEPFRIHGFWDRSLLEVFLDDGRAACTEVFDTRGEPVRVEAFADGPGPASPAAGGPGPTLRALEAWRLEPIW